MSDAKGREEDRRSARKNRKSFLNEVDDLTQLPDVSGTVLDPDDPRADLLDQFLLVDLVGQLGHDDRGFAVVDGLDR